MCQYARQNRQRASLIESVGDSSVFRPVTVIESPSSMDSEAIDSHESSLQTIDFVEVAFRVIVPSESLSSSRAFFR